MKMRPSIGCLVNSQQYSVPIQYMKQLSKFPSRTVRTNNNVVQKYLNFYIMEYNNKSTSSNIHNVKNLHKIIIIWLNIMDTFMMIRTNSPSILQTSDFQQQLAAQPPVDG